MITAAGLRQRASGTRSINTQDSRGVDTVSAIGAGEESSASSFRLRCGCGKYWELEVHQVDDDADDGRRSLVKARNNYLDLLIARVVTLIPVLCCMYKLY